MQKMDGTESNEITGGLGVGDLLSVFLKVT